MSLIDNKPHLKKVKELIQQLEEKQNSLKDMDYFINSKIMYIQALKSNLETDGNINIQKVEEIINRETEEVKTLLNK